MDISQLYEQRQGGKEDALASMTDFKKEYTDLKEGFKAGDESGTFMYDYAKKKQEGFSSMEDLNSLKKINKGASVGGEKAMGDLFDRLKFQQAEMVGARRTVDERLQAFGGEADALEGLSSFKQTWWKEDVTEKRQKEQHSMSLASQSQSMKLRAESAQRARESAAKNATLNKEKLERERQRWDWEKENRDRANTMWDWKTSDRVDDEDRYERSRTDRNKKKNTNIINNIPTTKQPAEKLTEEQEKGQETTNLLLRMQQSFNDMVKSKNLDPIRKGVLSETYKGVKDEILALGQNDAVKGMFIEHGGVLADELAGSIKNFDTEDMAEIAIKKGLHTDENGARAMLDTYYEYEDKVRDSGEIHSYGEAKAWTRSVLRKDTDANELGGYTDVTAPGEASIMHTENNLESVKALTEQYVYNDKSFREEAIKNVTVPSALYRRGFDNGVNSSVGIEAEISAYGEDLSAEEYNEFWDKATSESGELMEIDETQLAGLSKSYGQQYNINLKKQKDILNETAVESAAESEIALSESKYFSYGLLDENTFKQAYGEDEYNRMEQVTDKNKLINVATLNNSLEDMRQTRYNTKLNEQDSYILDLSIAQFEDTTTAQALGINDPNGHLFQSAPELFGDMTYQLLNTPISQLNEQQINEIGYWQGLMTGKDTSFFASREKTRLEELKEITLK